MTQVLPQVVGEDGQSRPDSGCWKALGHTRPKPNLRLSILMETSMPQRNRCNCLNHFLR